MGSFSQGKLYSCFVYSPVSRGEVKKPITWLTAGLSLTAGCQGFFPATIWGWAPASFIGSKRKIESKELPSCTIPLLLIAHTRQLEIFATAMWQQCKRLHKYKKPRWKEGYLQSNAWSIAMLCNCYLLRTCLRWQISLYVVISLLFLYQYYLLKTLCILAISFRSVRLVWPVSRCRDFTLWTWQDLRDKRILMQRDLDSR